MDIERINFSQDEDEPQARDEHKVNKRIQDYKDTMSLIKLKMNKADALIRQYNDKIKECNILNEEKRDILKKYNLTMEKHAKLELVNIEYKQSFEQQKNLIDKQKTRLEENEKHINQLIFKIKNTEEQNSTLEDKIKALQLDMKIAKKTVKSVEKKPSVHLKEQSSQTISYEKQNTSVNTDPVKVVPNNLKMFDKHVMTEQCLSIQKEPFPIFCTKCEMCIIPTPVEQILKVMSLSPPFLSEHLSPPNSPRLVKPSVEINEPLESTSTAMENNNEASPSELHNNECKNPNQITEEMKHITFMEIDKLTRKINKLEKLMKKRKTKKKLNNCFHKNCCISKNIKFILQMPSEKKFFKYRKRDKRKLKWLKNKYKRDIDVDGVKNFIWQIEDNSKAVKRKIESDEKSSVSSKKRKYCSDNDLFESSAVCIPKKISNDFLNEDICKSEKTFSSSKCSEASDCTSPSEITEVNDDNLRESSLIEDVAMTEFVTKLNDSACDLSTSQTLSSESTCYSNEEKENFVFDKVNEDITYNNIHSLPVRLENIEKNTYEVEVDNKIGSNDFVCNATNNSCDNNFMKSVNIVNNQTNENCSPFNEYSVSNIKSDILDKSISTCNHEISSEQNNEQNNSWIYNDKSERNNLSGRLELAVNMKDTEKCEESLFNLKCQDGALLLRESSEVLDCNRSVSRIESNITGCTENSNEENSCIKKLPASDLFSSTSYLFVKKHSSEDVIDKKNEREQNSDFHENDCIIPNEISNKFCLPITTTVYPSMHDKTEDENENLQVTCNDRKSENLSVLPVRPNSIEKDNHLTADSMIEIQNHKSFIEETSDFFDNSVNNVDEVHSISMSHDLNISLSATVDDNQHSNISAEHSTDETFDKKGSKPRSPRTRNELNKTYNANLAGGNRKKLLSKIRNLSRNSKKSIVLNNLDAGSLQFREKLNGVSDTPVNKTVNNPNTLVESVPIKEPPKKQRIAHTPKAINFNVNSESNNQIAQVMKRAKSLSKDQIEDNNDKVSIIMNEIDKTFKVMAKVPCTSSALSALPSDPISISSNQDNTSEYNSRCINPTNNGDNVKNCNDKLVKALTPSAVLSEIHQESPEITSIRENQCFDRIFSCQDNLSNNEHEDARNNATKNLKEDAVNVNNNENKSPVRELRSRQITINKEFPVRKKLYVKRLAHAKLITPQNSCLFTTTVISILNGYLSNPNVMHKYFKNKEISQFKHNEQFIMEQLELLTKLDEWTIKAHTEIIENLMTLQDFRYIALFIIEFIVYKMSDDETFDKTHTPPAPIMTRSEQKLITLILEIDKKVQNFSDTIIKGIQFRLFRLGVSQEVQIVERLFRILVVLNKIKKDREKVRIFCCDALYCLKLRAVNIIYVALMCWPEVLPKYDPNNDVIVKTIVHIIMSLKVTKPFPKLYSLKTLLFKYYNYPDSGYTPSLIKDELLKNLKENTPGVNTAMLLLCKSMGPSWAIENIIKELKQIIVTQSHPSLYEVLTLLGNILRPIRIETTYSEIYNIINQLCDVLDSNAGPDDLQEGVVSCLISISKFKYKQVARSVLKWQFNKSIRPSTNDKLKSFFLCQDTKWWWQFVQSNFPRPQQD